MADSSDSITIQFGTGPDFATYSIPISTLREHCSSFSLSEDSICSLPIHPQAGVSFLATLNTGEYAISVSHLYDVQFLASTWGCSDLHSVVTAAITSLSPERRAIVNLLSAVRRDDTAEIESSINVIVENLQSAMVWPEFSAIPPDQIHAIREAAPSGGDLLLRSLIRSGQSWNDVKDVLRRSSDSLRASHVFELREEPLEEGGISGELIAREKSIPEQIAELESRSEEALEAFKSIREDIEQIVALGPVEIQEDVSAEEFQELSLEVEKFAAEFESQVKSGEPVVKVVVEPLGGELVSVADGLQLDLDRLELKFVEDARIREAFERY